MLKSINISFLTRFLLIGAGIFLFLQTAQPACASDNDSIRVMYKRFLDADTRDDDKQMAEMILPADLGTAKKLIMDVVKEGEAKDLDVVEILAPYFAGLRSTSDLYEIDSVTFFEAIGKWATMTLSWLDEESATSKTTVLGIIEDTPDSKYVIYRRHSQERDFVGVDIVVHAGSQWYVSLEGDWMKLQNGVRTCMAYQQMYGER